MTLLENLCSVDGCSGGTIHTYKSNNDQSRWDTFTRAYSDLVRIGITFPSRASIDKLAAQHGVSIVWGTDYGTAKLAEDAIAQLCSPWIDPEE